MVSADDSMNEAMLARAFENLGASPEQARVMAVQLLKRAQQLAGERGTPAETALAGLLEKVVAGRKGEYTPDSTRLPPDDRARGKSG